MIDRHHINADTDRQVLHVFNTKGTVGNIYSELQIRGGTEDNPKIMFLFLNEHIFSDPSLDHHHETVLTMGHNIRFTGVMCTIIAKLSL